MHYYVKKDDRKALVTAGTDVEKEFLDKGWEKCEDEHEIEEQIAEEKEENQPEADEAEENEEVEFKKMKKAEKIEFLKEFFAVEVDESMTVPELDEIYEEVTAEE